MRSSRAWSGLAAAAVLGWATGARAQQLAEGFALDRYYASAPGGGFLVMDDLSMSGGLGGAVALSSGYAYKPLRIATTDGSQRLTVVAGEAFVDLGLAVTYDRLRFYVDFSDPIVAVGDGGTVGAYSFRAPDVDVGSRPDLISDVRLGVDARLFGERTSPFRLGAGAQLYVPNGDRSDYDSDGTFRAMIRALFAGDVGRWTYAGQIGVHVRPRDDSPAPGGPQGSELLYGLAAGARIPLGSSGTASLVVGPELYGETALLAFTSSTATGIEGLATGRLELSSSRGPEIRVKLGAGGGLDAHFGAPEARVVVSLELLQLGAGAARERTPAR